MFLLILLCVLPIFILFIIIHTHKTNHARAHLPPGPPPLPLIGNLHQLNNSSPHHSLWQLSKRYGHLMSLRLGSKQAIVISSSKLAQQVLKTHDQKFASRPQFLGPRKLSYNGLDLGFAPYSPYWREMKKICILHLFSSHRVQSFRSVREYEVAQMIKKLSHNVDSGKVVNLTENLMSFTSSLICRIGFGKRYGCEYEEVVELGKGNQRSRLQVLLNEAQELLAVFCFSDYFPLLGWVDRLRGILWRLDKVFKELDLFYESVIYDHMDSTKTKDQQVAYIIDILLQLLDHHSFSFPFTLHHIKALLMNIFIAGTDPSSATIVWAMTALLRNPEVMSKVQGEVRNLFCDKDFINEDDIQSLPYLKAVIKETLRLFPPSPLLLPRETMEPCELNGYQIQPKTLVYVNAWAIARDPETWEEPERFYPERFLDDSNLVEIKDNYFEMIPFGAGRRMCPGKHMGVVNVELCVGNPVHSFDWEVAEGDIGKEEMLDTQVKPGITMHKKCDLYLVAKTRSM
ncbi:hypothetical protein RJT34_25788 [Clitoria ternatea]|uniref:Cytochrome P450 n=1 Tax=Clitoria ternatea TaxID=43366 RepID=A0AAN9ILH9_CLITE